MSEIRPEKELLDYAEEGGHEMYQLYFHVNVHVLSSSGEFPICESMESLCADVV